MPKADPAIAASQTIVALDDYNDWSARRVATHTRVLEIALSKIKKEVELASYSGKEVSSVSFKQLFTAPEPASKWEWDQKTEKELMSEVSIRRTYAQPTRKQGYADASRRKGISLQPRRLSPAKEGCPVSIFKSYLQNPILRRNVLITGASQVIRPYYATVLSQYASIIKPQKEEDGATVPSLAVLSARAFGRAIVRARDPEDPQGDYSWYSYCDENSNMYYLLAETARGHITQLLCDALKEPWFPQDLTSTMIAHSVHAGDSFLTEAIFNAAYHGSLDKNRSIARRKGELAPDPFSSILYMPDLLSRQIWSAIAERPSTMLDAWFRDVIFAGIGEMGMHVELPKLIIGCMETLLGIEVWEEGVHRRRLNRKGKAMRKKYESFDKAWLFQSNDVFQAKAAEVAQDLMERLFDVGWGSLDVEPETRHVARTVLYTLVERMVLWAHAFNHPHKEASEGSSITARTLALCAVLRSNEDDLNMPLKDVMEELVRLLLVTMIEASEGDRNAERDNNAESFDLPDLAKYVSDVISRVYSSPLERQEFTEGLLDIAIGKAKPDFTQTPAVGDKLKMQQKRQHYLIAIFAYHLATSLAESSKSEASHAFASEVEQRLVGLRISKKGLLKASDLKTPKFSNLIKDVAQSEARNSRWVYEPMLNEWVEVPADLEQGTDDRTSIRKISRKLNFNSNPTSNNPEAEDAGAMDSDGWRPGRSTKVPARIAQQIGHFKELSIETDNSDSETNSDNEDTTLYPISADTTVTEDSISDCRPNFLMEVCIQDKPRAHKPATNSHSGIEMNTLNVPRQSKRIAVLSDSKISSGAETRNNEISRVSKNRALGSKTISSSTISQCKVTSKSRKEMILCEKRRTGLFSAPNPGPRKRGRPRKQENLKPTAKTKIVATTSDLDSAYEPDSDNDQAERDVLYSIKRRQGLPKAEKRKREEADEDFKELDIYQDELDFITAPKRLRYSSDGKGIFKDTKKSKLNMSNSETTQRKLDGLPGTDSPLRAAIGVY